MNNLEELAKQNKSNYELYLHRMSESFKQSSKRFIPMFITGNKILDVGCGSGALLYELKSLGFEAEGIDLNIEAITKCKEIGLNVKNSSLHNISSKYDTIIFSSVLHEFSSYDPMNTYKVQHIIKDLNKAYKLLNDNGKIIIRDGLKADNKKIKLVAKNEDIVKDFIKYTQDAPMFKDPFYNISGNNIISTAEVCKEFLYTYTWGKESYNREVKEQYGILKSSEWLYYIKSCGFNIETYMINSDNYAYYLSKYFETNTYLVDLLSESTILIVASKAI